MRFFVCLFFVFVVVVVVIVVDSFFGVEYKKASHIQSHLGFLLYYLPGAL